MVKIMEKPLLIHGMIWGGKPTILGNLQLFIQEIPIEPRKKKHLITFQYYTGWIL